MNEAERDKTEKSKGFGYATPKTKKLTKKVKKVYADSTSLEDIQKNKTVKHLKAECAPVSYKKKHQRIKNG